jgi:hypothetical protein
VRYPNSYLAFYCRSNLHLDQALLWVAALLVLIHTSSVVTHEIRHAHLTAMEVAQAGMLLLLCGH